MSNITCYCSVTFYLRERVIRDYDCGLTNYIVGVIIYLILVKKLCETGRLFSRFYLTISFYRKSNVFTLFAY